MLLVIMGGNRRCAFRAHSCLRREDYTAPIETQQLMGNGLNWRSSMSANRGLVKDVSRLHGYWIYRNFLRRSPFWPEERRRKYVMENLRQTLIRAYEGAAFYREQFQSVGFNPRTDFRLPDD